MRIRLTSGETVLEATLNDNETTRDFVSLLPLTLRMGDLFSREKYGHLPRARGVGDVAYWPPGPDVAIFYDHDGQSIPDPGIAVQGKIDSGAGVLKKYDGPVQVTIDVAG
jgi:hypothetical protein